MPLTRSPVHFGQALAARAQHQRLQASTRPAGRLLCKARKGLAADTAQLKAELQRLVANTQRGKSASPEVRTEVLQKIEALEALNAIEDPIDSDLLSGTWSLLYNGAGQVDDREWRDSSGEVEGPFLSFFKPITKGVIRTRGDTQIIDVAGGRVENIAAFQIFSKWDGSLNIRGVCEPVPPEETEGRKDRLTVEFTNFVLAIGSWSNTVSLERFQPHGWVQTTYLDEDFRVGRGDKGSVFVTARRPSS